VQTAFLIRIVSVVLQYGMLLFLFMFVLRVARLIQRDIKGKAAFGVRETTAAEAILTVLQAPDASLVGRRFAFTAEIAIGRSPDNDIVLNDTFVSHHHAVITRFNNLFVIEDLASSNHTYVNDECLQQKTYLQANDRIRIGGVILRFER
jgi:pSer/pThr/pTyr-binding forkhead associated (FHA) protein